MANDNGRFRVAALIADGFQEVESTGPMQAVEAAGAQVDIISDKPGEVQALDGAEKTRTYPVAETIAEARLEDYDAVFTPGGLHHPAILAADPRFMDFIRQMDAAGKPVTAICRGTYALAASGVVKGRHTTGVHSNTVGEEWWYLSVKDKMSEAGALFDETRTVVIDRNLITSRFPGDIPQFSAALVEAFGLPPVTA